MDSASEEICILNGLVIHWILTMFIKTIKSAVIEGEETYKMYDFLVKTGVLKFNARSDSPTVLKMLTKSPSWVFF